MGGQERESGGQERVAVVEGAVGGGRWADDGMENLGPVRGKEQETDVRGGGCKGKRSEGGVDGAQHKKGGVRSTPTTPGRELENTQEIYKDDAYNNTIWKHRTEKKKDRRKGQKLGNSEHGRIG